MSKEAKDLIKNLMNMKPQKRYDYKRCIEHPWIKPFFLEQQSYVQNKIKKIDPGIITRLSKFSQLTSFSREIMRVAIFNYIEEQEIREVRQAFQLIDQDQSGFISLEEISLVIHQQGIRLIEQISSASSLLIDQQSFI